MLMMESSHGGVYQIKNKVNGRFYIGSTINFRARCGQHLSNLRNGRHANIPLQEDWNKCGEEAFEFVVAELLEGDAIEARGKELLLEYHDGRQKCYNRFGGKKQSIRESGWKQVTFWAPEEFLLEVKIKCIEQNVTLSEVIRKLLQEWLREEAQVKAKREGRPLAEILREMLREWVEGERPERKDGDT